MAKANNKNSFWESADTKLQAYESKLPIPAYNLKSVPFVNVKAVSDLEKIPDKGGCYWIWTDEPVLHTLHNNATPAKFNGGEVIYNGIAKDNVRGRIRGHLFSPYTATWSGISVDILHSISAHSHNKTAMSTIPREKVPFIGGNRIVTVDALLKLRLSGSEKIFISANPKSNAFYFRNGINILDHKHRRYRFRVYYITGLASHSYIHIIEHRWREEHGLPRLCTYSSGR